MVRHDKRNSAFRGRGRENRVVCRRENQSSGTFARKTCLQPVSRPVEWIHCLGGAGVWEWGGGAKAFGLAMQTVTLLLL